MFTIKSQLFEDSPIHSFGEFPTLNDALRDADARFQFGSDMWIEQDGQKIVGYETIVRRIKLRKSH